MPFFHAKPQGRQAQVSFFFAPSRLCGGFSLSGPPFQRGGNRLAEFDGACRAAHVRRARPADQHLLDATHAFGVPFGGDLLDHPDEDVRALAAARLAEPGAGTAPAPRPALESEAAA